MFGTLKQLWLTIKLIRRADVAFAMASRRENRCAFQYLSAAEKELGPLTQYRFGIEPMLLKIFLKGCLVGIEADDYDWVALQEIILSASEYNGAEKLHLVVYLEELATTAGVSLSISDPPTLTGRVRPGLRRRFPKLSEA